MQASVIQWLDQVGWATFRYSAWAFVLLNGAGLAMVIWKRDRAMVNRWTSRFLAVDLLLLGAGLGVPIVTFGLRTLVAAVPSSMARPVNLDGTAELSPEAPARP